MKILRLKKFNNMKKLFTLTIFVLPFLGFSQIKNFTLPNVEIPKVEMPKIELPKIDLSVKTNVLDYKKFSATKSPAPYNMPIAKSENADLYKILVAKPKENLEKILIAKPKNE